MKIDERLYLIGSGRLGFDWTHPSDCNVYVFDSGDGLVMIDSGTGLSHNEIREHLEGEGLRAGDLAEIWLTHLHADHAGGAAEWRRISGAKVGVLKQASEPLMLGDEEAIDLPTARRNGFYPPDYLFSGCPVDRLFEDKENFRIGNCRVQVLHTPGHSRFDTSFHVTMPNGRAVLFSGDTDFYNGRISMIHTRDFHLQQLADSMELLGQYTVDMLLPGHGQPALKRGSEHIRLARDTFRAMGVPINIV